MVTPLGTRRAWSAAGLALLAGSAAGQPFEWTGAVSVQWSDQRNWDPNNAGVPGQAPNVSADVEVPPGAAECWLNTPVQLGQFIAESSVRIQHDFSIATDSSLISPWFGGGAVFAPAYLLNAPLDLPGGGLWTKGRFSGPGPIRLTDGILTISDSSVARTLKTTTLVIEADAVVDQTAAIGLETGASIENSGRWNLRTTLPSSLDPTCEFVNYESVVHDVAGGHTMGLKLRQVSGEVRAAQGTLIVNNGELFAGTLRADSGATLRIEGPGQPRVRGLVNARGEGQFEFGVGETIIDDTGVLDVAMTAGEGLALIRTGAVVTTTGVLRASSDVLWEDGQVGGVGRFEIAPGAVLSILQNNSHALRTTLRVDGEVDQTKKVSLDFGGRIEVNGTYRIRDTVLDVGPIPNFTERIEVMGTLMAAPTSGVNIWVPVHLLDGGVLTSEIIDDDLESDVRLYGGGQSVGDARIVTQGGGHAVTEVCADFEIIGGELTIEGDGVTAVGCNATFRANGLCVVRPGADLEFGFQTTLAGTAGVDTYGSVFLGCPVESSRVHALGNGRITMHSPSLRRENGGAPSTIEIDAGATGVVYIEIFMVAGQVLVDGELELANSGNIVDSLLIEPDNLTHIRPGGVLRKTGPGQSFVTTPFRCGGTVEAEAGILVFNGPMLDVHESGILTQGRYIAAEGATIQFDVPVTVIGAGAAMRGGSGEFPTTTIQSLSGGTLTASTFWAMNDGLQNQGTARSEGGAIDAGGGTIENGGQEGLATGILEDVLDPSKPGQGGFVCAALNNNACVRPGGDSAPGPFRLTGDLNQMTDGVIEVEIGGLTPVDGHDQMAVSGQATLGGTLDIALLGGFEPGPADEFVVMTFGSRVGTFDLVRSPLLADGRRLRAVYDATSVRLVGTCGADLTGDGSADGDDFFAFLDAFVAGDPLADVTGDGEIDSEDFFGYLDSFAAGGC